RAKKVRYYEDRRFTERVLPPPDPATAGRSLRTDGWSELGTPRPTGSPTDKAAEAEDDTANSGLRREPELPDHVAIAKETTEPTPAE
ncbi:conjugal transfer protein TraG, partial [Acinetobacter baumannii]